MMMGDNVIIIGVGVEQKTKRSTDTGLEPVNLPRSPKPETDALTIRPDGLLGVLDDQV